MVPLGWYVDSDVGSIGVEEFCLHPAIKTRIARDENFEY